MKIGDLLVRLGLDITDFSKGFEDAQKELQVQSRNLTATGLALSGAITAPLAGIGVEAVKAFAGFEASMNRVSALGDVFGSDLERLGELAKELGATTQYSAKQSADAMGNLAAAGFKANEIFSAMPGVLALAATENMKIADAAQIASDVLKGFQLQAKDMNFVADVLARTSASSANSVQGLGVAFSYVGPVAKAVNMDFLDVAAALGVLGDAGIRGERGGTALRNIINDLLSPSKQAAQAMRDLGIRVLDSSGKLKPLNQLIAELQPLTSNTAAATQIFGQRWSEIVPLLANGGANLAKMRGEINAFDGAAKKMASIIQQGVAGNWEKFTSSLQDAAIELGKALSSTANVLISFGTSVVNRLSDWAKAFGSLPEPIRVAAIAIFGLAAAAGPLLVFAGAATGAVANLKLLGPAVASVGSALSGIGPAAIAARASMGGLLESVKGLASLSWSSITGNFAKLKSTIVDFATASFAASGGGIKGFFQGLANMATLTGDALRGPLVAGFTSARTALLGLAPALGGVTLTMGAVVVAATALAAIAYVVYKNWADIKNVFVAFYTDVSNLAARFGKYILDWIETTFGKNVSSYITAVWTGVKNFFVAFWKGLVSIFEGGLTWIVSAAQKAASALGLVETAKALDQWKNKLAGVAKDLDGLGSSATKAGKPVQELRKDVAGVFTPPATGSGQFSGIGNSAKEAKHKVTELEKKMKEVKESADRVADSLQDIPRTYAQFSQKVSEGTFRATESLRKLEEQWRDVSRAAAEETDPKIKAALKGQALLLDMAIKQVKEYRNAWNAEEFDKELAAIGRSIQASLNVDDIKLPNFADPIEEAEKRVEKLREAYQALGMEFDEIKAKSGGAFSKTEYEAQKALEAFNRIRDSGMATSKQLEQAWLAYLEKKVAAEKEASDQIVFTGRNAFSFIASSASQTIAEFQLATLKATNAFRDAMTEGFKNVFSSLFKGNWGGVLSGLQELGNKFVGGVKDVIFAPLEAQTAKFLASLATGLGEWVTKNVLGVMAKGLQALVGEGLGVLSVFHKLFGSGNVVDAGKAAVEASKAAGAAAQMAKTAGDLAKATSDGAIVASQSATAAATASKQAAQAVTAAGQAASQASQGALKAISGVLGIVSSIVSAVSGVLSFLQGRRMEQDIGRIEVTTREIKAELTNLRDDEWKRHTGNMVKADEIMQTMRYFGDASTAYLSDIKGLLESLLEATKAISGSPYGGRMQPQVLAPGDDGRRPGAEQENTETVQENTEALEEHTRASEENTQAVKVNTDAQETAALQSQAVAEAAKEEVQATEVTTQALEKMPKIILRTDKSFHTLNDSVEEASRSVDSAFSYASGSLAQAAAGFVGDVQTSFSNATEAIVKSAEVIQQGSFSIIESMGMTEDEVQKRIRGLLDGGGNYRDIQNQIFDLSNRVSGVGGGASVPGSFGSPNSPVGVWDGPFTGISSTPIVLNVNVNNADARKVANEMVDTWRRRGVEI